WSARARPPACRAASARRGPIPSRRRRRAPPRARPWRRRRGAAGSTPLRRAEALSPGDARVEGAPRPRRGVTQLFLDAQELVVLRGPLAARDRAGLALAGVDGHGEVGDERVLRLAGAVGDDRSVARALGELDRLARLRARADLVHLDEHGVGEA